MSDRDNAKINVARKLIFEIFNSTTGLPQSGVSTGTLTVTLLFNAVTPSSPIPSVTLTELGNGRYLAVYTPNVLGYWYLSVRDPVDNPQGWVDEITCTQLTLDDFVTTGSAVLNAIAIAVLTFPLSSIEVSIRGIRCLGSVVQRIRNKILRTSANVFATYETDNSTVAWNTTTTTDPAQLPVIGETPS